MVSNIKLEQDILADLQRSFHTASYCFSFDSHIYHLIRDHLGTSSSSQISPPDRPRPRPIENKDIKGWSIAEIDVYSRGRGVCVCV